MPVGKMKQFLDANGIQYLTITHSPAYTAAQTAGSAHVPGAQMAKVVMVMLDGRMGMVVIPSTRKVDLALLRELTGVDTVAIAEERAFRNRFPDCEPGAMPPFGNLYGMDVYVAEELCANEQIAFNAGSHSELVKMAYSDFERLVHPRVVARLGVR